LLIYLISTTFAPFGERVNGATASFGDD